MLLYPFDIHEWNYLASLALRDLHTNSFNIKEAKAKAQLVNRMSLMLMEMRRTGNSAIFRVMDMEQQQHKVPPSEENLDPQGNEIMDAPLTDEEVEEAVARLQSKKHLGIWSLLKRW